MAPRQTFRNSLDDRPLLARPSFGAEPKIDRQTIDAAKSKAEKFFKNIGRELGDDVARQILGELFHMYGESMTEREIKDYNNETLLEMYDHDGGLVNKLARKLARLNDLYQFPIYGARGGHTAKAIDQQLLRLLKKRGRYVGGQRGRPPSNKEAPQSRLMELVERYRKAEAASRRRTRSK